MDVPMRIVIALSIVVTCVVIGIPALVLVARRRRREKRRRRGIKDYNRSNAPRN